MLTAFGQTPFVELSDLVFPIVLIGQFGELAQAEFFPYLEESVSRDFVNRLSTLASDGLEVRVFFFTQGDLKVDVHRWMVGSEPAGVKTLGILGATYRRVGAAVSTFGGRERLVELGLGAQLVRLMDYGLSICTMKSL